jgi:hypothetical protein
MMKQVHKTKHRVDIKWMLEEEDILLYKAKGKPVPQRPVVYRSFRGGAAHTLCSHLQYIMQKWHSMTIVYAKW